jgi:2-amino-4-hydroxy-6-hydroxymethyldihydropteridine diphosphokinase
MPTIAYIGVGSNVGDKKANCRKAFELLADTGRVISISSLYYTEPVGYKEQEDFINAVVSIETDYLQENFRVCRAIEEGWVASARCGGDRAQSRHPAVWNQMINQPHLVIPHPDGNESSCPPLAEIAPGDASFT